MKSYILSSYARLSDALLIAFFLVVFRMLTRNPSFPNIDAKLDPVKRLFAAYQEKYEAAKKGSTLQKTERDFARTELLTSTVDLVAELEYVARGNRIALLSTGFPLNKDTRTPVVVEQFKKFTVVYGQNIGELIADVKRGKGAKTVIYQYTLDAVVTANSMWITVLGSGDTCTFINLPVGKIVNVRAGAIGSKKQPVVYSSPITMTVR